ncbi:39S ribosomal protein L43, mitochondrial [Strongyloides ratti]|uniref:Large ribosomal subunit protein mL43 n=1 Tax=Strongyloides ratti TaxID=34506 RepID=A0A090L4K2_STRRB|nr:39S ribosomal protein L43, mitochondrial [Strongyloides ratti]CEF64691.1 39S ribosomal protein L43, mitochondrial [Strongyloides ratti]
MPARVRVDRLKPIYTAAKAINFGFRLTGVPTIPNNNGVGSYIPQVHRITLRFCKQNEASSGVRSFIKYHLFEFAQKNPSVVIYTIPARQVTPTIRAEYGNGRMVHINVKSLSLELISQHMHYVLSRSGEPMEKLISKQSSIVPSIQGEWNPFTFQDPEMTSIELPDPKFSKYLSADVSATEYVRNLVNIDNNDKV